MGFRSLPRRRPKTLATPCRSAYQVLETTVVTVFQSTAICCNCRACKLLPITLGYGFTDGSAHLIVLASRKHSPYDTSVFVRQRNPLPCWDSVGGEVGQAKGYANLVCRQLGPMPLKHRGSAVFADSGPPAC
jgi:hypothetical protein